LRIHPPEISKQDGNIRVSARVEPKSQSANYPEFAWFEFPEKYESFLYLGLEGFVVAMLPFAMMLNEDIIVQGALSSRLAYHLQHWQTIKHFWHPKNMHPIQILADEYTEKFEAPRNRITGMMHSGGIDSLFTLSRNLPAQQPIPEYQIKLGIFLDNFDFFTNQREATQSVYTHQKKLFNSFGMDLMLASHNIHKFNYGWFARNFPVVFSGLGHILSNGLRRLTISGSYSFFMEGPVNSDMRTDQALGSDRLDVVYDAIVEERVEKIQAIMDWEPAQKYAYVCRTGWDGHRNCGRCLKCTRTMISLHMHDRLEQFELFPDKIPFWTTLRMLSSEPESGSFGLHYNTGWARKHGHWSIYIFLLSIQLVAFLRAPFQKIYEKLR
jgi:hypothetical protein